MTDMQMKELREKTRPIFERYGIEKALLFGSRARGEDHEDSDYDFLISKGDLRGLIQYCGLIDDLENILNTHVDVVSDGITNRTFVENATAESVIIYERILK